MVFIIPCLQKLPELHKNSPIQKTEDAMLRQPENTPLTRASGRLVVVLILIPLCLTISFANSKISLDELSIELSPQAQEAINNGVALKIDCEFANIESYLLLTLASNKKTHYFTLSRHALSNRYIVKRDNLSRPHMFSTIAEATNYITTQAVVLLESYTDYDADRKMRLRLNKFELPSPMRLQAFIFDEWDLDTGWLTWNFES